MKENTTSLTPTSSSKSNNNGSNLTTLPVDISPSSSNFFEVLYIGKIKVWNKKVPDTFIDDALEKFKAHDLEKARKRLEKLRSESFIRRGSVDIHNEKNDSFVKGPHLLQRSQSVVADIGLKSPDVDCTTLENVKTNENDNNASFDKNFNPKERTILPKIDDHNRTMVLQIDRTDLRLISPDRKVILLQKHHKDITTCVRGVKNSQHFGFVSKEGNNLGTFIGYVFKCESQSISTEVVGAITQSFNSVENKPKPTIVSCEHCPMVWFHKLCCEIENLSDKKTQGAIIRRIEQLDEEEQTIILTKYRGVETDSIRDQNELLMMLLRAHCEMKQGRHVHDSIENRTEFLNQYLGIGGGGVAGNTIFMKAKRSLTTSFDNLLKRRASKDDFSISTNGGTKEMTLPVGAGDCADCENKSNQKDELDVNGKDKNGNLDKNLKSPMMDIFLKVGTPKSSDETSPNNTKPEHGSYRQAIFKRVITPRKNEQHRKRRTPEELRTLWKNSIRQAILLVRMEKENARLKARQEEKDLKRVKLEYDELFGEKCFDLSNFNNYEIDEMVKNGIPKIKRGEIWNYLADKFDKDESKAKLIDLNLFPNYYVSYENLLKQLTSHQHAILIDLGRTYPAHPYYKSPLGPGQLALFNLLKAYSLLDPEVGYCQGLSFVAGVLLLHMEESQAFSLLRHLMFQRDLRKQYLPDMIGLQIKLYQLSRLLHDKIPELYDHFDLYEIAPTLYAAPWLLTMFASQFPLGFVSRVFDLIFADHPEVVFKISMALLTRFKDDLLKCENFEEIMGLLKNRLPRMVENSEIFNEILTDINKIEVTKKLNEYKVEYLVLQEEILSVQPQVENLNKLEETNKSLIEENKNLKREIDVLSAEINRLEMSKTKQNSQINNLITQNRGFEVTISALTSFINTLIEEKVDVEIPGDVRRILSQFSLSEKRKIESKNNFLNAMFKKTDGNSRVLVKSLSTGKISEAPIRNNGFFAKSYNHIMQRQRTLSENDECEMEEKPLQKNSPTNSIDSGVYSPRDEDHPNT
nr:TBC1 domain family member 4-like isoform X3 [Onthophagus taurus]